jgi:hypothetical protein
MTSKTVLAAATCGAVLLALGLAPVDLRAGDDVPLKATVVTTSYTTVPGVFPVLAVITSYGEGKSTHLGKLTTSGVITLTWTPTGIWSAGTATTIAANGDRLDSSQSGWTTGPGAFVGTFTITGGTGRFAGATGGGTVTAAVDEDGVQTAVYAGTIDYKKK